MRMRQGQGRQTYGTARILGCNRNDTEVDGSVSAIDRNRADRYVVSAETKPSTMYLNRTDRFISVFLKPLTEPYVIRPKSDRDIFGHTVCHGRSASRVEY